MRNLSCFALTAAMIVCGCGKKDQSAGDAVQNQQMSTDTVSARAIQQPTVAVLTPVLQPILTAWQEGHTADAVNLFMQANWNARPIFPPGMAVGLTDTQLKALSDSERQLRNNETLAQLDLLKQLAAAVNAAGDEAAAKGDAVRARQIYNSLTQFGAAISDSKAQQLLQLVGQVCRNMGEQGLGRLKT